MGVALWMGIGKRNGDGFGLLDIHGHGTHGLFRTPNYEKYPFVYKIRQQDNTEFTEAARFQDDIEQL